MRHHQGTAADPHGAAPTPEAKREIPKLTRVHKILIGLVTAGAVVIAAIGFAGSYDAVRKLAVEQGFGNFSLVFPIGIDAGIVVLLALDLLLTWIRIPFPLLRQTAWLLTTATIAFNGAAAWPNPLGVGMHAVIPVLFVVSVEAARHAVGRIADITADKHMEGVRLTRWLLSPVPTFKLWRRMKLWELRSYEQTIKLEQDRLVYQARLQSRFGRGWRRKAPVEALMPLRLAKYGVPLAETGPAGLAAAGIEVPQLERVDVRPELTTVPHQMVREDVLPHHHRHGNRQAQQREPEPSLEQGEYEAFEAYAREQGEFPTPEQLAELAQVPVAARRDGRPPMVQARVGWFEKDLVPDADEAELSPIGDSPEPLDNVGPLPEPGPGPEAEGVELTGVDLLEHRYLQLSPEERGRSASAIARLLYEGSGFTVDTAR
ncbi:DUF2637 domain-containing protein, partial [Streptomyces sp. NPDC001450]